MDWKIELVAIPVTDVDRAKAFYVDQLGFVADHDHQVKRRPALRAADPARLGLLDLHRDRHHRGRARHASRACRSWWPTCTPPGRS